MLEKTQIHKSTSQFLFLISNAVIGAFFFGYSVSYMNPAIKTIDTKLDISSHPTGDDKDTTKNLVNGVINALPAIGAIFGALSSGICAKKFGIRMSFVLADMIGILGFCLQLFDSLTALLIGRFVIGYAVGLNSSLVPQYIKEFSPEQLSGPFGAMFQMTINIGCLVALIMGMFFDSDGSSYDYFRFVAVFPMLFCSARIFFLAYFFQDDPPSFYLQRKKFITAKEIVRSYYKTEYVDQVFNDLKLQNDTKQSETEQNQTSRSEKKRIFIGCILQVIQQFSGINAVLIYSSGIFIKITAGNNTAKNWLNIGVGLTNLVFSVIAIPALKKYGRRPLLLIGTIVCATFLGLITLFASFLPAEIKVGEDTYYEEVNTSCIFVLIFMFSYLAAFQLSLGPVVWIYDADILNEFGMSIAVFFNWSGCAIVAQFFGYINDNLGMNASFGIFFAFCTAGVVFIFIFVKETKDKTPQEIDAIFDQSQVNDD